MRIPLVSVIVAAYNAEHHIAETLESIRAQTFNDYEVIVVDDGSTDSTPDIVVEYPQVRYLRQANRGQPAARNTGIRAARGTYVAFVDADDLWFPSKLEKQVVYLLSHPQAAWIYSDAVVFDSGTHGVICRISDRSTLHEGTVLRPLLLYSFIPSATPVIKRNVFEEVGMFDESGERRIGEDWNVWLRIAERYPLAVIREPLAAIRVHDKSMTRTTTVYDAYLSKRAIIESAVARNAELVGVKSRALASVAITAGLRCLGNGDGSAARRMLIAAIHETPWCFQAYCYFAVACLPVALQRCVYRLVRWFRQRPLPDALPGFPLLHT